VLLAQAHDQKVDYIFKRVLPRRGDDSADQEIPLRSSALRNRGKPCSIRSMKNAVYSGSMVILMRPTTYLDSTPCSTGTGVCRIVSRTQEALQRKVHGACRGIFTEDRIKKLPAMQP